MSENKVVVTATINPARKAVEAALSSTHSVLIEGTETRVRSVAPLDDKYGYDWLIIWLTNRATEGELPAGREITFNRYCAWTVVAP